MHHTIQLSLTPAEWAGLRSRCAEFGMSREDILIQFIRDFGSAPRNGGSNERDLALAWAELGLRTLGAPPRTERARQRADRLRDQAYRATQEADAELRSQPTIVTEGSSHQGIEGDRKVRCHDGGSQVGASIQHPASYPMSTNALEQ